jgi:hypothetical protein
MILTVISARTHDGDETPYVTQVDWAALLYDSKVRHEMGPFRVTVRDGQKEDATTRQDLSDLPHFITEQFWAVGLPVVSPRERHRCQIQTCNEPRSGLFLALTRSKRAMNRGQACSWLLRTRVRTIACRALEERRLDVVHQLHSEFLVIPTIQSHHASCILFTTKPLDDGAHRGTDSGDARTYRC